jgi:hypothetical protein
MTLKEVLTHLQTVGKCDASDAWQQLRVALAEGAVLASWPMSEPRLRVVGESKRGRQIVSEAQREEFWRSVRINLSKGTIVQQEKALQYEDGRYVDDDDDDDDDDLLPFKEVLRDVERDVWVLKESIRQYWKDDEPESTGQTHPQPSTPEIPTGSLPKKRAYASDPQIRETAVQIYDEAEKAGAKPPNVIEAFPLVKERLAPKRAPKRKVLPILAEDQFENRRWKPGQHSPKN